MTSDPFYRVPEILKKKNNRKSPVKFYSQTSLKHNRNNVGSMQNVPNALTPMFKMAQFLAVSVLF